MRGIARCAVLALGLAWAGVGAAAPADEVRALVEKGQSAQAYALGKQYADELGKPDFDFYFGIAAIDSGHAGEGVLAMERYIVLFPDNDRARLELARGYYVLGELIRAREEFENVSRRNPPPQVQATIDRFLDSIRSQETRYTTTATFYAEIGGGYDSNVNSGASGAVVNVPTLGVISLARAGVKADSGFSYLGLGGNVSHPVAPGVALVGGASYEGKFNSGDFESQFDTQSLGVYGGASVIKDRDLYRATLGYSELQVDYRDFRNVTAGNAEWHRQVDELNTLSLFGQAAALRYPDQPVRDSNFYGLGVGWRRAFIGPRQPVVQVSALGGQEKNQADPERNDLSRNLGTLRAGISFTPAPNWGASGGISYTKSKFAETDPLFLVTRKDDYYGVDLGLSYRWSKAITLRADYLYSDNKSNIDLFEYQRSLFTLKLRYEYR